ncbi:SDR family oxidoreductase [Geobacter anodireducens]|uniref:NADP-dependent 3-hydroxy acid dehydrogenase YdfG n=1 Tax=Geobacter soli TaxID=1510391 RepID=A0A0C1TWV3_9BACT|nr:SDR family oxidoreductase [Geobacter soli]ANA39160.1 NAD(P)-dependent oxidoreductase [Geobacter anodireducens]KIE43878.1 malonic semialdehyde reductase [Geobacter soli]HMN01206.1 SDR family oxidoreductase [Geobacter anodireducens]
MSRTVFITGASAGFGAACARLFADRGDRLVLAARREEPLLALRDELAPQAEVHTVTLDVRRRKAVQEAVEGLPDAFSRIDILVNNAGLALGLEPAHETNPDDWDAMVDTNIKGLIYCTRFLLPGMVARNRGHIVNIGSVAGSWPYPGGNVYGGTKAFVEQFSRNLRADLLGKRVRVTCLAPGMAETEFSMVRFKGDAERAAQVYAGTQALTAEDIAGIVAWVTELPPHVNVNALEVMSIFQSWGPLAVHRPGAS